MDAGRFDTAETPVLIIGAGAAGLRTAIELAAAGVRCLVIGKRRHGDAHTRWAAGGINASLGTRDPADRWELHFADTVREGHFVCDPAAVELLCRESPDRVRELHAWGCPFSETDDGRLDQRYFGAQSYRRTCFAGDATGDAILSTLVARAQAVGVPYRENLFVSRILVEDGEACGAIGHDMDTGRFVAIRAGAVVLAAGGCTSAYQRSSSRRDENNGDAAALAYDAGATLRDMEFVQFHPTGMVHPPELRGRLVTEAVRGEGGRLYNADGERFMERYSPDKLELDARDVVARAIYREIQEGRATAAGAVLLDISHRDACFIRERLPEIAATFAEQEIDISREPMEVAPTAHYAMGGVRVDFATGATDVPKLFAVGEATAGVHGANRLGGNSLAETVVFGRVTGAFLAARMRDARAHPATPPVPRDVDRHIAELERLARADGEHDPQQVAHDIGSVLWQHAGIVRDGDGLREGLAQLDELARRASRCGADGSRSESFAWLLNTRFMLRTAEMILRSALLREESRGAHFRADAPEDDPHWQRTIACRRDGTGEGKDDSRIQLTTHAVPEIPVALQPALQQRVDSDYHHLE
jgi:succinate dehydrogenase / fumarate reductase, flavoprotein subunit